MYNIFIYLECWDGEPNNRPTMSEVVERLKTIILQSNMTIYQPQDFDNETTNNNVILNNSSHEELSQLIQNFVKMNTKSTNKRITEKNSLSEVVNKIVEFIFKMIEKGKECRYGELCIRGPNIMKGYLDNEKETNACIDSEGWLHTGDLVSIDKSGE